MNPILVVSLVLNADGKIGLNVQGPASENELVVLGLLEKAKQSIGQIFEQQREQAAGKPELLVARGTLPRNGKG